MHGLDSYTSGLDARHQAAIDAADADDMANEEISIKAEADFEGVLKQRDIDASVPNTETFDWELVQGKSVRKGPRAVTLCELMNDYMDRESRAKKLLNSVLMCAADGNPWAVEVINEIKQLYVNDCISNEMS